MKSTITLFAVSLISCNAFAESACEFTVFDVGLGFEESRAAEILESQGFRRIDSSTFFTSLPIWPPEGVELSAEEIQYADFLSDPPKATALWRMAETDPELKSLLEGIPAKPEPPHQIDINLGVGGPSSDRGQSRPGAVQAGPSATGIRSISVIYIDTADRWLGRNEPGVIEFSDVHAARDAMLWARYCSNAAPRDEPRADFSTAERDWICATENPAGGTLMQITVQEKTGDRCMYQYSSRGKGGDEKLLSR